MTDYSSWAYDFVLTGRPVFIYTNDSKDYDVMRGLYYPLSETPFPICETEEEISRAILELDTAAYEEKVKAFLDERGCYESGSAAKKTVDWMLEHMEMSPETGA